MPLCEKGFALTGAAVPVNLEKDRRIHARILIPLHETAGQFAQPRSFLGSKDANKDLPVFVAYVGHPLGCSRCITR